MKTENLNIVSQNDRIRKFYAVLVGLVLIFSGIFISTVVVGIGGSGPARGARQPDLDNTTNDFAPVLTDFTPPLDLKYINNGTAYIYFNVSVYDDDESNDTTVPAWNGTDIASVTINLTEFGIPNLQDMSYIGNFSEPTGNLNSSRMEGWYEFNFTIPNGWEAGNYTVTINATDNGTDAMGATGIVHIVKVYQYNRPPGYTAGPFAHTFDEDAHNTDALEIDFTALFTDADVDNQPFNNTDPDSLTFKIWFNDAWFSGAGIKDYENFTLQFNGSDGLFLKSVENMHVTGQTVNLSAMDEAGEMAEHLLTITITSVNDDPVLNGADNWDIITTDNVTAVDATTLQITQGNFADMNVTATDADMDTLYYAVELDDFDGNSTALTAPPFFLDEMTGNLNFTPDNDAVGTFFVNISVRDSLVGTAQDYMNFSFEIANANDPPMITTVDATAPTDKAIALAATQDVDFNVEVVASDVDVARALDSDELTFAVDTTKVTIEKTGNTTANLTFTPTNDDVGDVVVNITIKDAVGTEVDDYVVATITVADVNDAPAITGATDDLGAAITITDKMIDLTTTPLTENAPNVTFTLTAADIDMPYGEILDWDQEDATIPALGYMIEKENENQSAKITIMGEELANMVYTFNFTVMDDGTPSPLSDYVEVMVEVNISDVEPPVNVKPTITLTSKNIKAKIGESITINGTVADDGLPATGTLTVKVKITSGADTLLAETAATVSAGTFTYTLPKLPEKVGANSSAGTWTITVWANDGDLDSTEATTTLTVEKKAVDDDDDDDELPMSMGMFAYDILVILIIIIIIVILILAMATKKKVEEEVPPPEEGMVPAEGMPPAEVTCTACGQLIPAGSPTCPACGAPAPPPPVPEEGAMPEEGMPPEGAICATCGATIPAGSPMCPACGAPAPPPAPAEGMPPEEGMAPPPEEGMAPPEEGMAPPEGAPPEAPAEGMPPEAPPPEGAPPEAPPPEGMPPEAPPEAPPPEGAPPEQAAAPPPGMATCPQCGAQLAVGATPCPGCGAALNW